jgi:hypothetical protein
MKHFNIKSIAAARKALKKQGTQPIPGHAYNFYDCGCIIDKADDSNRVKFFSECKTKNRSCPTHIARLHIKYKQCKCGHEAIGMRIIESKGCTRCPQTGNFKKSMKTRKERNGDQQDPGRCDCEHYLSCLTDYIGFDAVPCKGCENYKPGVIEIEYIFNREPETVYTWG